MDKICNRPIIRTVFIFGVLFVQVFAFAQDAQNRKSRFNFPSREESRAIRDALHARAGVYVCRDGAILMPGQEDSLTSGYAHAIVKRNGYYSILDTYDGVTEFGCIVDGGAFFLTANQQIETQRSAVTSQWPMNQDGQPKLKSSTFSVIASQVLRCSPKSNPPGSVGWAALLVRDRLLRVDISGVRPENVLWIIPSEDGGLRLEHSGPLHKGKFLSVTPDRIITFEEGFIGDVVITEAQRYWTDLNIEPGDTRATIYLPIGMPVSSTGQEIKVRCLWKNNRPVSVSTPPVE